MFNLDGLNHGGSFRIKYQDDEGDLISITDDEELQAAFALAKDWDARTPFRMEIFRCPSTPHNRGFPKPKPLNPPVVEAAFEEPIIAEQQDASTELPTQENQDHGKDEPHHQESDECQWGHRRHGGRHCGRPGGGRHRGQGWGGHRRGKWGGHGHNAAPQSGSPPWMEGRKSRFISDVTLPDGVVVAPGSKVCKIWKLANCGSQDWPSGTKLLHVGGDSLLERPEETIVVDPAAANGEVDVAVDLIAPEEPGRYISYFRLCGPRGMRFGQRIWVMLVVAEDPEVSDESSGEQEPLTQKQLQKLERQAAKRERQMAKQAAKAHKLTSKSEQLAARAAKIKASQQGGKNQDPASLAIIEEKVRHIEAQSRNFADQAAAIQATLETVVELSPEAVDAMSQLTPDQQAIVAAASLTSAQLQAVCTAVATQHHLGIVCDATHQQPIIGVRYTKPSKDDTYDLRHSPTT